MLMMKEEPHQQLLVIDELSASSMSKARSVGVTKERLENQRSVTSIGQLWPHQTSQLIHTLKMKDLTFRMYRAFDTLPSV